jgi:hypothetical protein
MRPNDRFHGSLRMLLILFLVVANIVAAFLHPQTEALPKPRSPRPVHSAASQKAPDNRFAFAPPTMAKDTLSPANQP